jgi:hypothetical protein
MHHPLNTIDRVMVCAVDIDVVVKHHRKCSENPGGPSGKEIPVLYYEHSAEGKYLSTSGGTYRRSGGCGKASRTKEQMMRSSMLHECGVCANAQLMINMIATSMT